MHWITMGVVIVVLIGLTILRIGMRGSGRGGAYMVFRILLGIIVLGVVAWRFWAAQHH